MSDAVTDQELFDAARRVRRHAHVPYSQFPVGAALLTDGGQIFVGANVENAAYPEGMCAEASAIAAMVSAGHRQIETLVTVCGGDVVGTPCGGCRQKIREFANASTRICVADEAGIQTNYSMADLLPDSFGPQHLGRP